MFSASIFRVKRFFLKKNLSLRSRPGGRRRRLPKEGRPPCQPGFSAILRRRKSRPSRPQKIARGSQRLPRFVTEAIRLERGDYVGCVTKARSFSLLSSGGPWRLFSLRGPGGQPVSERGGDIRTGFRVRKRHFRGGRRFSRTPEIRACAIPSPGDIGPQTLGLPRRLLDMAFDHVADRDDAGQAVVLHDRQVTDPTVGHPLHQHRDRFIGLGEHHL